jgi:hypothetical protein
MVVLKHFAELWAFLVAKWSRPADPHHNEDTEKQDEHPDPSFRNQEL